MSPRRVVGVGAGGHARVVIEILRAMGDIEIVGLLDVKAALWGTSVAGVPVVGDDTWLPRLRVEGLTEAFIGVGTVGDATPRRRAYELAKLEGFRLVTAIHPAAVVSPTAVLGQAPTIMAGAIINAAARLGDNVIVNTGAIVEHDCLIGDHVHIASGACLASAVEVGEGSHIGLGAAIRQCVRIGRQVIVGAGAVVIQDVPDGQVVVGVPARALRGVAVP